MLEYLILSRQINDNLDVTLGKCLDYYIRIWQFTGKYNTLESLYIKTNKTKTLKLGNYNSIKYTYVSTTTTHKTLGRVKIVFIKTKDNLIPIISTNTNLSDIEIINTYKKRWNIEQGYKDLQQIIHVLRVYTKKQLGFMCES